MDKSLELRKCYGRLKALHNSLPDSNVSSFFWGDYISLFNKLTSLIDDDLKDLSPDDVRTWEVGRERWCSGSEIRSRIAQLIGLLEFGYSVGDQIVEIGSLYNSIKDSELRDRCSDLLIAPGNFDRVINQATLILEDRIRKRAGLDRSSYGAGLVNIAINSTPQNSKLILSTIPAEQEGYANIIRGIMQALRNETHHAISGEFSREDAFAICGFIDRLLRLIGAANTNK